MVNIKTAKAVCLLSKQACANLYGGTGGSTEGEKESTDEGTTTTPTGSVRPKLPVTAPDPDI